MKKSPLDQYRCIDRACVIYHPHQTSPQALQKPKTHMQVVIHDCLGIRAWSYSEICFLKELDLSFGRCRACRMPWFIGCLGISPCSELCTFLLCWPEVFLAKEGWEIGWNVHPGGAKMKSPADWLNFLKKPWFGISAILPETNSSHLHMDGWNVSSLFAWPIFRDKL